MAEENKNDTHIRCSKCKSKYVNGEEHISKDFGYTRLEEIYKTCVRCRDRGKVNHTTYRDTQIMIKRAHQEIPRITYIINEIIRYNIWNIQNYL